MCKERVSKLEAQSYILVPQISKTTWVITTLTTVGKLIMYYTNYHHTNHNMEMCQNKKKEKPIVVTMEVNAQLIKPLKPLTYPYHICGMNMHKLTKRPRFNEMKTMFKDKSNQNVEKKHVADVKVTIASMNVVDVHVTTTRSKVFEA